MLTSAQEQAFISIRAESGVLAIARLSIAGGWAGLTAVEVDPARRRAGLGLAITAAACAEAVARGVRRVFLQVEVGNAGARALYERCGFRYSHRYHYRMASRVRALLASPELRRKARHAGKFRALVLPMPAGYSLRLSSWLPLGPGARLARGAGGRARSTTTTTTMSRRT